MVDSVSSRSLRGSRRRGGRLASLKAATRPKSSVSSGKTRSHKGIDDGRDLTGSGGCPSEAGSRWPRATGGSPALSCLMRSVCLECTAWRSAVSIWADGPRAAKGVPSRSPGSRRRTDRPHQGGILIRVVQHEAGGTPFDLLGSPPRPALHLPDSKEPVITPRTVHDEQAALRYRPVQDHPDSPEVHLGLSSRRVLLRDECRHPANGLDIDLRHIDARPMHPHCKARTVDYVSSSAPCSSISRARSSQPPGHPLARCGFRQGRRPQGLRDRSAVDPMPGGQCANGHENRPRCPASHPAGQGQPSSWGHPHLSQSP